jgi:hypothetical protein
MRAREFITESLSTNILIVDVQPAYDAYCRHIVHQLATMINNRPHNITMLYNAEGLTEDDENEMIYYLINNGVDEDNINNINFIEKSYGFFRGWMDTGISDHVIIKTIRAMNQHRVNDSRDLDLEEILGDDAEEVINNSDNIYMPDFMSINTLRQLSPFYMCGGGRSECLREIELLCNAFNIKYKRMDSLIYG